ncbi:hypothetical protein [Streptomyces sp. NPDC020141]|uniref:nSTAND1 domain-containing NTPase n=1 Tax=Streptomyces sp. NPDC020141 TaxID=3365065 RepID=UPI00378FF6EC
MSAALTVRADFSGRRAAYGPFAEALRDADLQDAELRDAELRDAELLGRPLTPHQLRQAVGRPAAAQRAIAERALTARIVADADGDGERGGLPLMAHALREVWRRRSGRLKPRRFTVRARSSASTEPDRRDRARRTAADRGGGPGGPAGGGAPDRPSRHRPAGRRPGCLFRRRPGGFRGDFAGSAHRWADWGP